MMDTAKFIKEYKRMCDSYTSCKDCPNANIEDSCGYFDADALSRVVQTVEEWSAAHPRKTYRQDFLEKFPKTKVVTYYGVEYPGICRRHIYQGVNFHSCNGICAYCWDEPMEE